MSIHTPFLQQIARVYVANEADALIDYVFVTPNKRTGVFLTKHIGDLLAESGSPALLPATMTISELVESVSPHIEASRIELIFILYNTYREVLGRHLTQAERDNGADMVDFNRFIFWGDMLLNDFNDVDNYMADAPQIFKNIDALKEISANYLTDEQIEVIRKYWDEDFAPQSVTEFWKHTVHTTEESDSAGKHNVAGFVKIWQVMSEIYAEFKQRLYDAGLTYSGMSYRDAAETLAQIDTDSLPYRRYIFVGFYALSESERQILKAFKVKGIGDYYWDFASPAFAIKGNRGRRFIEANIKEFASLYPGVTDTRLTDWPQIDILAVPSTFGQAKALNDIIRRLHPKYFTGKPMTEQQLASANERLMHTAIVLPDENLIQAVLNSLPPEIPVVNVTMGFTLRHSPIAGLLKNVVSMQLRARQTRSEQTFFYDDVIAVLTDPTIRRNFSELADEMILDINRRRLFNIPYSFFTDERYRALLPIFSIVADSTDPDHVISYLTGLFDMLESLYCHDDNSQPDDDDKSRGIPGVTAMTDLFIRAYREALSELIRLRRTLLRRGQIYISDTTVFHLVERIAGNIIVRYEGQPLKGLQVMGVLEARNLDFDNVIILSMNERIFPRKHYERTFIPSALRHGYGLATIDRQESMYAYYFYRMIARADNVFLMYDARTSGIKSGAPSRYIKQLRYQAPPDKVHFLTSSYPLVSPHNSVLTIDKDDRIMAILERYRSQDNPRNLSAHSINSYISCPMTFYLSAIEGYREDSNELLDYMDDSTYGTIIHEIIEHIYTDARGDDESLPLTQSTLARLSDPNLISRYVETAIRKNYFRSDDDKKPLFGDSAVYLTIMTRIIKRLIEREAEQSGVEFIKAEDSFDTRVRIDDNLTINFTCRIDRVDRITDPATGEQHIRLVDYKTGNDDTKTNSIDTMFDCSKSMHPKSMLQLMLYANAYAAKYHYKGAIEPTLFKLRTLSTKPISPLKISNAPLIDYLAYNDAFLEKLGCTVRELFDPATPFVAKPSSHACMYCHFKRLCNVEE